MKKNTATSLLAGLFGALLTMAVSSGAMAGTANDGVAIEPDVLSAYLQPGALESLEPLDAQAMATTQGELWPLIGAIGAVVAVDIALQAYFWGVYLPAISEPMDCGTCQAPVVTLR